MLVGGVRVRGRIDRIDRIGAGRVAIVDYKTGAPKDEMDARKSLQLSIYALAARDQWHMVPERLIFYNLQTNEGVSSTRTDEQLRKATEEISEVAAKIAEGRFEPTPGFHCRACAYSEMCPATEERLYTVRSAGAGS